MENNELIELQNILEQNGIRELKPDDLEGVAGGVITEAEKLKLKNVLVTAKSTYTLDEVLALVPTLYSTYHKMYPKITQEDVENYIKEVWDSL